MFMGMNNAVSRRSVIHFSNPRDPPLVSFHTPGLLHNEHLPVEEWEKLTSDKWVLDTISFGARLNFIGNAPPFLAVPKQSGFNYGPAIREEISDLISKKAVIQLGDSSVAWISNLFLVPKKDGGQRPVINLAPLNRFLVKQHFKMESFALIPDLLKQGDWLAKIDLKDAYLSVPIHADHQKFLAFSLDGKNFAFQKLPFGLSPAPRIFTKLIRPVARYLRSFGIRLIVYLDDWLLFGQSIDETLRAVVLTTQILQKLGFTINWEKSIVDPVTTIEFLGLTIDSIASLCSIPERKISIIVQMAQALSSNRTISCLDLSQFIGTAVSLRSACSLIMSYVRFLQKDLILALGPLKNYNNLVSLSPQSIKDLEWFCSNLPVWKGENILPKEISHTLTTDASKLGWGAVWKSVSTGGSWDLVESRWHINVLEMKACLLGIKSFISRMPRNSGLRVESDSRTVVAYLRKGGGTKDPQLILLAREISELALSHNIELFPVHIRGVDNTIADRESRVRREEDEWSLSDSASSWLFSKFGVPDIDLFASRLNYKVPVYVSWFPDPDSLSSDAFSMSWRGLRAYAFPPFCLAARVIAKALRESVTSLILVAPIWEAQAFTPLATACAVESVEIPHFPKEPLLTNNLGQTHPCLSQGLRLGAWKICPLSGDPSDSKR